MRRRPPGRDPFPSRRGFLAPLARGAGALLVGSLLMPRSALGDGRFRVIPTLAVTEVHDDNLFFSPPPAEGDWIWRLSPALGADYRSAPLTVRGRYGFDAERYAGHPGLNDAQARRQALLEARYLPRPAWELSFAGGYWATRNADELNIDTGVTLGRLEARRLSLAPTVSHRFDPVTTGSASYSFVRDEVVGGTRAGTQVATLAAVRRLGARDSCEAAYRVRGFAFDGVSFGAAHVATLRWSRRVSPVTGLQLEAGPRVYRGRVEAELAATLDRRFRRGFAALRYSRSQATLLGQAGVVQVDALSAGLEYSLSRALRLSAAPGVYRSGGGTGQARVRRLDVGVVWYLARRLAVTASQQFSLQTGTLVGAAGDRIPRRVLTVGLMAGEI
jgi:hypothetical protein